MAAIGGNTYGSGDAVVNVYINHEKKFAFMEKRTVKEASNAMALDGIIFEERMRREKDRGKGQSLLMQFKRTRCAISGAEGPDRIFVGGLPYYFTEVQIRELLESFGPLRGFDLVKDRDPGNSKGYGFCVYQAKPDQEIILAQAQQQLAIHKMALQAGGANLPEDVMAPRAPVETPTKVVCLTEYCSLRVDKQQQHLDSRRFVSGVLHAISSSFYAALVVSTDELRDDEEYKEILEHMWEEGEKFGVLGVRRQLVLPRLLLVGGNLEAELLSSFIIPKRNILTDFYDGQYD